MPFAPIRRLLSILPAIVLLLAPAAFAQGDPWALASEIVAKIIPPAFPPKDFPILDYGAIEGGTAKNTEAFAKAIAACNAAGGGRVVVPAGSWLTGAIHLKSNVNLHVSEGAVILFSVDPADYLPVVFTRWEGVECMNYSPLIYAFEQENVAVTGKGTLDAQGANENWWQWCGAAKFGAVRGGPNQTAGRRRLFEMGMSGAPVAERVMGDGSWLRPNFIQPYRCKNVLIEGVTVLRSPMWEIHPVLCENVTVRGVTVRSHGPNNDGCNPESCNGVLIDDCTFDTGDDCIALKSGRNNDGRRVARPIENVLVRNSRMKDGHGGVVIGSEISGGARNIFAEDCAMDSPNLERMLRIKTNAVRGGLVENVHVRNITVGQVSDALVLVDFNYEEGDNGEFTPTVRNISVKNVTAKQANYGLYLRGYERSPVSGIAIENAVFEGLARGNLIEHAKDVTFTNVVMNGKPVATLDEAAALIDPDALPPQAPPSSAMIGR